LVAARNYPAPGEKAARSLHTLFPVWTAWQDNRRVFSPPPRLEKIRR
jgi:hypothetical protein